MKPPVRPHAHLCPDCHLLFWCTCPNRWAVDRSPCGCRGEFARYSDVEIPESIDPSEIPY